MAKQTPPCGAEDKQLRLKWFAFWDGRGVDGRRELPRREVADWGVGRKGGRRGN